MFSFLKPDPIKKLQKQYDAKLEQAMKAQRNGDIRGYSEITAEAEKLYQEIQSLRKAWRGCIHMQEVYASANFLLIKRNQSLLSPLITS